MRRIFFYLREHFYLEVMVLFFFFLTFFIEPIISAVNGQGFIFNPVNQVFKGYLKIITSPSILITDYVYIAGLGATFFNVATILVMNLVLIHFLKIRMNGPIFAGIIMISGFSFFGKNFFNTLPIYFGIYLFSLFKHLPYKSFIITLLFSTGISPLVSYTIFGFGLHLGLSIPLGICCGILAGFIIPAFASHTIVFHEGYNLYNTGFALGVISACFYGIFKLCNLEVVTAELYDYSSSTVFYYILPIISVLYIMIAFFANPKVYVRYFALLKTSGRLISDYAYEFKREAVLLNFGILGLFLFFICLIFKVPLNGVIFGSILSILGFAGYGLHLRNVLPVWVGAGLTIFLGMVINQKFELSIISIITFIFASGLAPISGRYGIIYGLAAGALHIVLTPLMINFQGGFDLYNNGLSAGFVAAILTVVAEKIFTRGERRGRKSKDL